MNYFAHPTAVIDEKVDIGDLTNIWHFSHIMSNSKIGIGCNIGQNVVISPDVKLGNNVKIGGQAGISGHLKIGNNVEIAGGSGVIKDIPENSKVMGYPAKNIRDFLKDNK